MSRSTSKPKIDLFDMRYFWFVGPYLVWVGAAFPWLHAMRRTR